MAKYILIILFFAATVLNFNCKKNPVSPPQKDEPDTTSHSFTWQIFEFGDDGASPSSLKDVAIINDSDIWAVGSVYLSDSTGQPDYNAYNAIHCDGNKWELRRITVNFRGNPITLPLEGAITFSTLDIWLIGSLPIHGDGKNWTLFDLRATLNPNISLSKVWGVNSNKIYFVGRGGNLIRYENNNWDKINTGTTIELTDIYGLNDGKTIWACGYAMDYSQSCILKFDGTAWKTIWSTNAVNKPPYGYFVSTIWAGDKYLYVGAGDGIYRTPLDGSDKTKKVLSLQLGPHRIRGSAENNIAVAVDDGSIWHYNGATWFQETPIVLFRPLYSIAVTENTIVGVGFDATTSNIKGIIIMGRRN